MATYNGAKFLAEQLDSILSQTRLPDEIVICDDGSTDETETIVRARAAVSACPIRFERNPERLGYARNFLRAASLCGGDIIAFCDQDDWWHPSKLERAARPFADPDVLLVYHNVTVVDERGRALDLLYDASAERAALALQPLAPWHHSYGLVQLFRSSLRQFNPLWDRSVNHIVQAAEPVSHDQWYFFLAQVLGRVVFLDDVLGSYRQHGGNAVGAIQKRATVGASLTQRFEHYGWKDDKAAQAASARAEILKSLNPPQTEIRARALYVAECYELLAGRLSRRASMYRDGSMLQRLRNLLASARAGDYRDWPWGFDRRSIVRDLISGVLLHKYAEPAHPSS